MKKINSLSILISMVLALLLSSCQRYNPYNATNESLIKAAKDRSIQAVKEALDRGAELNYRNKDHLTAVHIAAQNNDVPLLRFLIKKGAWIYTGGKNGTPLRSAINNNSRDSAKILIKYFDVKMLIYKDEEGRTILHDLAAQGDLQYLRLLHKKGAIIRDVDKYGNTLLHQACGNGHIIIADYLIKYGLKINKTDNYGNSPLHNAAYEGYDVAVKFLLNKGAKINQRNKQGKTPLFYAVQQGRLETVKILVRNGANINITDNKNRTPLFVAQRFNRQNVFNYLRNLQK